jgi:hypothetical protein
MHVVDIDDALVLHDIAIFALKVRRKMFGPGRPVAIAAANAEILLAQLIGDRQWWHKPARFGFGI